MPNHEGARLKDPGYRLTGGVRQPREGDLYVCSLGANPPVQRATFDFNYFSFKIVEYVAPVEIDPAISARLHRVLDEVLKGRRSEAEVTACTMTAEELDEAIIATGEASNLLYDRRAELARELSVAE